MAVTRTVSEQFGPVAAEYATFSYHERGPDLQPMLHAGAVEGHERVLDIGCGPGHTALLFAPHVKEVVALDPTEEMLDQARRLAAERELANLTFVRSGAEAIPYPDGSFDRVTSRQSAHHYADLGAALREVVRVLSPDGRVVLIDTFAPEHPNLDAFLNRVELLRDPTHGRDYRVSEWRKMFAEVGLEMEDLQRWKIPLDFEGWVHRSRTGDAEIVTLRHCFETASPEARACFEIQDNFDWSVPIGLVVARPRVGRSKQNRRRSSGK